MGDSSVSLTFSALPEHRQIAPTSRKVHFHSVMHAGCTFNGIDTVVLSNSALSFVFVYFLSQSDDDDSVEVWRRVGVKCSVCGVWINNGPQLQTDSSSNQSFIFLKITSAIRITTSGV